MLCNMTFISLESFKNSGLAALRIPSEPWQEASSHDFEAAIADISSQLDQASHKGKVQKEIVILPNIVLPILSETCEEDSQKDNQEDTVSVITQVHFMPDRLMTIKPSVEIPTRIILVREPELTVDVEAMGDRNDLKTSDVVLSIPVTLSEAPQSETHQETILSKGNEVGDLLKTSESKSSPELPIDLSLKPTVRLNTAHAGNIQLEQNDVGLKVRLDVLTRAEEMKTRMNVVTHDGIEYTAEWSVKMSSQHLTQLNVKATEAKANKCGTSDPTVVDAYNYP